MIYIAFNDKDSAIIHVVQYETTVNPDDFKQALLLVGNIKAALEITEQMVNAGELPDIKPDMTKADHNKSGGFDFIVNRN